MKIGYIYGFNAYPPQGGDGTHVYQLVHWFIKRGHTVLTLGDYQIPSVERYHSNNIDKFLRYIDLLYIRIDGGYLYQNTIKKDCMDRASVPIVWEINTPANERLARYTIDLERRNGDDIKEFLKRSTRRLLGLSLQLRVYWEEEVRRKYARKVDAAICVSNELKRYSWEALGIKKSYTLPNGSDPNLFNPRREPIVLDPQYKNYFKVVYAGSPLYPWQGLDILQRVVDKAEQSSKKILFILIVNQITPDIPRNENVLVFEKINYFDVGKYILLADVCLCLYPNFSWSKWGLHYSPTKLFDYMACGKPVIASRDGQIQNVIDDNKDGLLTNNDPDDVLQKILFLFEHREKIEEMGKLACGKVINYYNWQRVADATLEIFSSLRLDRNCSVNSMD